MAYTSRIGWEKLRSLDSSTMSSSSTYYTIGGPLLFPSYKLKIVNNSTVLVTISIDGANDYDVLPATSFALYDNDMGNIFHPMLQQNTQFSAKASSAGTGLIYIVSQYLVVV